MKHVLLALSITALLATPAAAAEEETPDWKERMGDAGDALVDSLTSFMDMMESVVSDIPQYEAPEIQENGDIIIRRKDGSAEEDTDTAEDGPIKTSSPQAV